MANQVRVETFIYRINPNNDKEMRANLEEMRRT